MFTETGCERATFDSSRSQTSYFDFIFYKHATSLRSFENKCNFILKLSVLRLEFHNSRLLSSFDLSDSILTLLILAYASFFKHSILLMFLHTYRFGNGNKVLSINCLENAYSVTKLHFVLFTFTVPGYKLQHPSYLGGSPYLNNAFQSCIAR